VGQQYSGGGFGAVAGTAELLGVGLHWHRSLLGIRVVPS